MTGGRPGKESLGQAALKVGQDILGLAKRAGAEVVETAKRSVDPNLQLKRLLYGRYEPLRKVGQTHSEAVESVVAGARAALEGYVKEVGQTDQVIETTAEETKIDKGGAEGNASDPA